MPLFSENSNPENCTLDRLDERSKFIIDIAKILNKKYQGKLSNLIKESNNLLNSHTNTDNIHNGLYNLLKQFKAFGDPTFKKSTVFIQLLVNSNLMRIKDPQNFVPDMDYHIQRVMLRMGCVEILDENLKQKIN
jgi:hypothetical protein